MTSPGLPACLVAVVFVELRVLLAVPHSVPPIGVLLASQLMIVCSNDGDPTSRPLLLPIETLGSSLF